MKATERTVQIVVSEFATNPVPFGALRGFPGNTAARKRIDDEVVNISEHSNKKLGNFVREARGMGFELLLGAIPNVCGVAFGVRGGD